jgi:1-deoxy-D-xylulose-5-phosphate reductoisomerase
MRLPIQYALGYPERLPVTWESVDWPTVAQLTFEAPDFAKFPALRIAFEALRRGGTAPAIMNVVNELAVYAFLEERIGFSAIAELIEKALTELPVIDEPQLADILNVEPQAREFIARALNIDKERK